MFPAGLGAGICHVLQFAGRAVCGSFHTNFTVVSSWPRLVCEIFIPIQASFHPKAHAH